MIWPRDAANSTVICFAVLVDTTRKRCIKTLGKVVECDEGRTHHLTNIVVVYKAITSATCTNDHHENDTYYAKVFHLRDVLQHDSEQFPLQILPSVPTSAVTKGQMNRLKWMSCAQLKILLISFLPPLIAWLIQSWAMENLPQNDLWRIMGLPVFWLCHAS